MSPRRNRTQSQIFIYFYIENYKVILLQSLQRGERAFVADDSWSRGPRFNSRESQKVFFCMLDGCSRITSKATTTTTSITTSTTTSITTSITASTTAAAEAAEAAASTSTITG